MWTNLGFLFVDLLGQAGRTQDLSLPKVGNLIGAEIPPKHKLRKG